MSEGFGEVRRAEDGLDVTIVNEDGATVIPIRGGGARPEVDQGLLLADGRLYGPGTRQQAMEAAKVLPGDVDWEVGFFTELCKKPHVQSGPL